MGTKRSIECNEQQRNGKNRRSNRDDRKNRAGMPRSESMSEARPRERAPTAMNEVNEVEGSHTAQGTGGNDRAEESIAEKRINKKQTA